jgi:hypothetical protein
MKFLFLLALLFCCSQAACVDNGTYAKFCGTDSGGGATDANKLVDGKFAYRNSDNLASCGNLAGNPNNSVADNGSCRNEDITLTAASYTLKSGSTMVGMSGIYTNTGGVTANVVFTDGMFKKRSTNVLDQSFEDWIASSKEDSKRIILEGGGIGGVIGGITPIVNPDAAESYAKEENTYKWDCTNSEFSSWCSVFYGRGGDGRPSNAHLFAVISNKHGYSSAGKPGAKLGGSGAFQLDWWISSTDSTVDVDVAAFAKSHARYSIGFETKNLSGRAILGSNPYISSSSSGGTIRFGTKGTYTTMYPNYTLYTRSHGYVKFFRVLHMNNMLFV